MSKADELKAKNENLFKHNTILLNENERLKKENAELNNFIMQSKKDGISPINALIIKNLGNQLTKAKEIIKTLSDIVSKSDSEDYFKRDMVKAVEQAEQFLKE